MELQYTVDYFFKHHITGKVLEVRFIPKRQISINFLNIQLIINFPVFDFWKAEPGT